MRFPGLLAIALVTLGGALGIAACRHDVTGFTSAHLSDAGEADGGSESMADAGQPFPYRWQENNPGQGHEEGILTFKLGCERDGQPATDCVMRCRFDDQDLEGCFGEQRVLADPGDHQFCVTVRPPESDAVYRGQERVQCVSFNTKPYSHPFLWQAQMPDGKSTQVSVTLTCAQEPPPTTVSQVRKDCTFFCSLDHIPYADCFDTLHINNVAPGSHELRVKTCGPLGSDADSVCRARLVKFEIAQDATPTFQKVPVMVPDHILTRAELGDLGALVDPYLDYAALCGIPTTADEHEGRFLKYLSYALYEHPAPEKDRIAACKQALVQRPADCWQLPGMPDTFHDDIMLYARLPRECRRMFGGGAAEGTPCLTHAACLGVCERAGLWGDDPSYGYCGEDYPADEGIMCMSRGCVPGFYCFQSACRPVKTLGMPCNFVQQGVDCADGLTCGGTPFTCIPPSAKLGEACRHARDCVEGTCVHSKCAEVKP